MNKLLNLKDFLEHSEKKISLEAKDHVPKYSKKEALSHIKEYTKLGQYIYRKENIQKAINNKFDTVLKSTTNLLSEEYDDWFDSITVKRNLKEIQKYKEEFDKTSSEIRKLEQRRIALYEDMGMILNRYFDLDSNDQ